MAFCVVRALPHPQCLAELRDRLDSGVFVNLRPFGEALTASLKGARRDPETGGARFVRRVSRADHGRGRRAGLRLADEELRLKSLSWTVTTAPNGSPSGEDSRKP